MRRNMLTRIHTKIPIRPRSYATKFGAKTAVQIFPWRPSACCFFKILKVKNQSLSPVNLSGKVFESIVNTPRIITRQSMARKKGGLVRQRPQDGEEDDDIEPTDVVSYNEMIVWDNESKGFQAVPLIGSKRRHGLLSLLKEEEVFVLNQGARLKKQKFQFMPNSKSRPSIYLFASVRAGKLPLNPYFVHAFLTSANLF